MSSHLSKISKVLRHVNRRDCCLIIYSWGQSNGVPEAVMDNASHAVSHTALLHTLLSDFRWDGTLTFIHNVFVFLGAAVKRRRKRDQNSTKQLCLGKETIYQKRGVIYASLLALTPTVRVSSHLRPASSGNCSRRSITAPKDRFAALCN